MTAMKTGYLLLMVVIAAMPGVGQSRLFVSFNPGTNLHNSENSLPIIGSKALRWSPGFSVAYESDSLWGFGARVEYSFSRSVVNGVTPFPKSDPITLVTTGYFWDDLSYTTHNIDLSLCYVPIHGVVIAAGPTISLAHRTISVDIPPTAGLPNGRYFEDRLVSYCAGANGSVTLELPVSSGTPGAFVLLNLKLRYLHSFWFDARGRDLDNYHQSSLVGQFGMGFGVAF